MSREAQRRSLSSAGSIRFCASSDHRLTTGVTRWTAGVTFATAGDVLFAGSLDRFVTAYDETSGAELWKTRLPDVPNGSPVTYEVDGRQFVAVVVGMGSPTTDTWIELIPEVTLPPVRSSAIFVFALPD